MISAKLCQRKMDTQPMQQATSKDVPSGNLRTRATSVIYRTIPLVSLIKTNLKAPTSWCRRKTSTGHK